MIVLNNFYIFLSIIKKNWWKATQRKNRRHLWKTVLCFLNVMVLGFDRRGRWKLVAAMSPFSFLGLIHFPKGYLFSGMCGYPGIQKSLICKGAHVQIRKYTVVRRGIQRKCACYLKILHVLIL